MTSKLPPVVLRVSILCFLALFFVHNFACIFYFCAKIYFTRGNTWP